MIPFDEALAIVLNGVAPLGRESVPLSELAGRVLAAPAVAPFDLPAFDRSAVDGYGIRAAEAGRLLELIGEVAAGDDAAGVVIRSGQAVRLFTGSAIPAGVDAVAMQEYARREGGHVVIEDTVRVGESIRRQGAELRAGAKVIPIGTQLSPPLLSLLATMGFAAFEAFRRPTVRLVATGNELVNPGSALDPGQVYESIAPGIAAAAEGAGAVALSSQLVRDDPAATISALRAALDADVVISCGGVSVGDHDLVRPALAQLGVATRVGSVAMRPGKPFYFGLGPAGQRVFGLPGNPVSALVTFAAFVRPVLLALGGRPAESTRQARLDAPEGLSEVGDRDDFLRARLSGDRVRVAGAQESHMLTGLAFADALLRLPAGTGPYADGDSVDVLPLRWG